MNGNTAINYIRIFVKKNYRTDKGNFNIPYKKQLQRQTQNITTRTEQTSMLNAKHFNQVNTNYKPKTSLV